ncbi:MAG: o-succinylbenzoate--CoA ligase [Halobacteriota archaeon]|uniref:o-succinylbenzoate--CoA ligase n=1 Tax=Natronomonas sp. TaxID=2184060 RepID=UPI0039754821
MRDWLAVRAHSTPKTTALRAAGPIETDRSYAELNGRVETLAGRLAVSGVCVDDPVAICSEARSEFVTTVHAVQRLGAVLVPINARLTATEIETQLDRVDPTVVICERETEATIEEATDGTMLSFDASTGKAASLSEKVPEPFDIPEWELDDPLVVMFTSGTTGQPKAVVLTLGNVLASATASAFRLGLRSDDCWHDPLPMYHMGGLAPVYRSVLYGTALSMQREFDPEATLEALEAADSTAVSLVPTMLERLLDAGAIPDLRFVLLGGAPCPSELLKRAQRHDVPVAPTYGMTETASQIATARPEVAREAPESVGHPLMFAELSVVDRLGVPCEPGEPGELIVTGPMVTPGYLDEGTTADRFVNGGLRTGDKGYRDEDGRVYVLGRADVTIVTGGENVDPVEVCAVLRAHPEVADCSVVGLDDEQWGERVGALVVPLDDEPSIEALDAHCRERLAGYKIPRTIGFATALPRTASGTVDRDAVVDRLLDDPA